MTKPGDSQTKKTIHELAKEFPDKTYRELEKYRDADRQEEAEQIPLTESQKSQDKLEPIGIGHNRPPGESLKKACTLGEMRKDRTYPDFVEVLAAENDKLKKEKKNLKWIKDQDYIFLIDENKKLHEKIKELKENNKKLAHQIEDRISNTRKAGF